MCFVKIHLPTTTKRQNTSHQTHTTVHRKFTVTLNHSSLQNKMTDVVIQQHSRKLLMMDILMSETCWTHKKWNKITSDIKLVFYSSTILLILYRLLLCSPSSFHCYLNFSTCTKALQVYTQILSFAMRLHLFRLRGLSTDAGSAVYLRDQMINWYDCWTENWES